MGLMIILVIIPGIFINRWLTAKSKKRNQRGFEVIITGTQPVLNKKEDEHG
jgi:hypothetical protein